MAIETCPRTDQLSGYLLGTVSEEMAEVISGHLLQCEKCEATVDSLELASDTVIEQLRVPPGTDYRAEREACRRAVALVAKFGQSPGISVSPDDSPDSVVDSDSVELGTLRVYQLLEKIGEGGMGAVYLARHLELDKIVALKVLSPEKMREPAAVSRFKREMKAVGRLEHTHIVRAMDAGEEDSKYYLVMEYIHGLNLAELVRRRGPLRIADACELIRQAALGLQEAHEHGMVHRDIKPSNLMLAFQRNQPPLVKILDLGLAQLDDGPTQHDLTDTGQLMGTIDYMAPEQARDTKHIDIRADIYSLGATLFKLLTGRVIFQGEKYRTPRQKVVALDTQPAPPIQDFRSDIPDALAAVIQRVLAKNPADRFNTPAEVAAALLPYCGDARLSELLPLESLPDLPPAPEPAKEMAKEKGEPAASGYASFIVGACLFGILALLGALVFYVPTPQGTLRVQIDSPDIEAKLKGERIVFRQAGQQTISLRTGKHRLVVTRGDFTFETDEFLLKDGETTTVQIKLLPQKLQVVRDGRTIGSRPVDFSWPKDAPRPAVAPFNAEQAKQFQQAWAVYAGTTVEREVVIGQDKDGQPVKLAMVLIPAGEFVMGSTVEERTHFMERYAKPSKDKWAEGRIPGEHVPHRVILSQPYYLGKFEVTQAQWEAVMRDNPSKFPDDPSKPVENMSWTEIQPFLQKLNAKLAEGAASQLKFALPTEAQWEFGCRAGTTTVWHSGGEQSELSEYAWFFPHAQGKPHPVGELKPNAFGLYDMHGNVWEWCADWYAEENFTGPVVDPFHQQAEADRAIRGGSAMYHAHYCRSASREHNHPGHRFGGMGFRLSATVPLPDAEEVGKQN